MELTFKTIRSASDPLWTEALTLCRDAFPRRERRDDTLAEAVLADPAYTADVLLLDGRFAGILFHWDFGAGAYIEHLATRSELRGQSIGSRALTEFCRLHGRVVLEIEEPVDELTRRREGFYRRCGFATNPHDYIHPSYCRPFQPHRLVLMSWPEPLKNEEARTFADFIRERVLLWSDHRGQSALPAIP